MFGQAPLTRAPAARGTSLIEVLVALLIMSLGLFAMISLHTASIRYHKISEFQGVATQLMEDFGDRMRANVTGVTNNNYIRNVPWSANQERVNVPAIACPAATCTEAQWAALVAANDLAQWLNNAVSVLPGAGLYAIRPAGAAAASRTMDVWVMWLEPGANTEANEAAANQSLNNAYTCPDDVGGSADLRCLRYRFIL